MSKMKKIVGFKGGGSGTQRNKVREEKMRKNFSTVVLVRKKRKKKKEGERK